jgi:mono/diheme cytochrome c family protein
MICRLMLSLTFVCGWLGAPAHAEDAKPTPEALDFFEAKIRPVLIDNCTSCHGEKKQSAGLRLDSRKTILEGGDAGPAALPGEPDTSLLVKVVRYEHDYKMPPKGKLKDNEIADITAWVKMGLPYPATAVLSKAEQTAAARKHWAFQPIQPPTIPPGSKNPVDAYIDQKLVQAKLKPNPTTDRRTLYTRLSYTLLGLPPKPEELEQFCKDEDENATEKAVQKLLASPHYGERWGRHWLDYARYSDTKGYLVGNVDRNYPYAYTYRDWVVQAFNSDMPYDRFVQLQLAADKLAPAGQTEHLPALGFLTVGRRFLNNVADIMDDRIDVVTRTFLGLSVSCARCHDHKFDPISTQEYYGFFGVFNSSVEPPELPLLATKRTPAMEAFEAELKKRKEAATRFQKKRKCRPCCAIVLCKTPCICGTNKSSRMRNTGRFSASGSNSRLSRRKVLKRKPRICWRMRNLRNITPRCSRRSELRNRRNLRKPLKRWHACWPPRMRQN